MPAYSHKMGNEDYFVKIPFDNNYACSYNGDIKTLPRMVKAKNGKAVPFNKANLILKKRKIFSGNMVALGTSWEGGRREYMVDYLVCICFLGEVEKWKFIKHIDGNIYNDTVTNLKIVDIFELNGIDSYSFTPIIGYPNYIINRYGVVINVQTGRPVKPVYSIAQKCMAIRVWRNNTTKLIYLYRLLAIHFIPNPDNKSQVNHKDGDRMNLSIDNLEWSTPSENMKHAVRSGLARKQFKKGSEHVFRKLSLQDVYNIRKDRKDGISLKELSKKYNVGVNHICKVSLHKQTIEYE